MRHWTVLVLLVALAAKAESATSKGEVFLSKKTQVFALDSKLKRWAPQSKDARLIESSVEACLTSHKLKPEEYYRQYAGYFKDGRKMIIVNFFCEFIPGWQKEFIYVFDGGPCFARIDMDMLTKTCNISINGEA